MEQGNTGSATKRAAVNGLAVVGFVALIFAGITLAVYAARFVPGTVTNLSTAAVYFASIFSPEENGELEVVGNDTVIPFPDEETPVEETPVTPVTPVAPQVPTAFQPTPTPGTATGGVYVIGTTTAPVADPYGLPDLEVTITERGYLSSGSTSSYVKADEVPDRERGAIKFVVTNKGTNHSGEWKFMARVPTSPAYTFTSPAQKSIAPGAKVEFILGFDRARSGDSRTITIEVDSAEKVDESNEGNNRDTETLVIN